MSAQRLLWPMACSLWTIAVGTVVLVAPGSPIRPLVVLPFLLVGPGISLVRLLGLRDVVLELTLACSVGIMLATLVASAMAYFGGWLPRLGLAVLMCITLGASLIDALRARAALRIEASGPR